MLLFVLLRVVFVVSVIDDRAVCLTRQPISSPLSYLPLSDTLRPILPTQTQCHGTSTEPLQWLCVLVGGIGRRVSDRRGEISHISYLSHLLLPVIVYQKRISSVQCHSDVH
jgi:hypothetical protein